MSVTRKQSPRKAALLSGLVIASTALSGPAFALHSSLSAAAVTPSVTTVTRLSLATGAGAGGEKLLISGVNLAEKDGSDWDAKAVKFGASTVSGANVEALSKDALEVTTPAGAAGKVTVLVGDAKKGPTYTYTGAAITVGTDQDDLDALEPEAEKGLANVEIAGTNFDVKNTKVLVGGKPAKASKGKTATATKLTVDFPAGVGGVQDVVVSDTRGSKYVGYVTYSSKSITAASYTGKAYTTLDSNIVVTGTNLDQVKSATFDAVKATPASTKDATKLTVKIPKGAAKTADLVLSTAYGKTATLSVERVAASTPTVTGVSGSSTSAASDATISGTNLSALQSVTLTPTSGKAVKITKFTDNTATSAKFKLAKLAAGDYKVVAVTPAATASAPYTMTAGVDPVVSSPAPTLSSATISSDGKDLEVNGANLSGATKFTYKKGSDSAVEVTTGFSVAAGGAQLTHSFGSGLAAGSYTVSVTTPGGTSLTTSFTVPAPVVSAPTVSNVVYDDTDIAAIELNLTGTNLGALTKVTATDADDEVTEYTTGITSSSSSAASVALEDAALAPGVYQVTATNSGGTSTAFELTVS